jgi:hypothetical protein
MGVKQTKSALKNVNDYAIVTVPKDYTMLKIVSYYIDLRISANIDLKIAEIITYIMDTKKNINADIINLQGIYDIISLHLLVRDIRKYCTDKKIIFYFAPEFCDIDADSRSEGSRSRANRRSRNLEDFATGTNSKDVVEKKSENFGKRVVHNIILSTYPIIGTIFAELDDKTNMDDIFGIHTVIGANILIANTIVSIYNTCLSKDIRTSNVINDAVRTTELDTLCHTIKKNQKNLKNLSSNNYTKSNIHLIIGNLNIPEIANDDINSEYIKSIKNNHFVDIFRYKLPKDFGYTTSYNERQSYILQYIEKDLYNTIQKTDHTEVLNLLFKQYKIHFMDLYVVKPKNIMHYPIECILMVKSI